MVYLYNGILCSNKNYSYMQQHKWFKSIIPHEINWTPRIYTVKKKMTELICANIILILERGAD